MRTFDEIVVGSGISGMTLALLLGLNGRSVLLLEKSSQIGGSMARFRRNGIPFDTGFHFTGGLCRNGVLHDMLTALGIDDLITPIYIRSPGGNRFVFEKEEVSIDLVTGYQESIARLEECFPADSPAIGRYFEMVESVCQRTAGMDLRKRSFLPPFLDEDYVTLGETLDGLTGNRILKGLLAGFSMCHGVKPAEISFANHSRVSYEMHKSLARVEGGGEAFIQAFRSRSAALDIETMTGTYITECVDVKEKRVGRFVLSSGEEVSCERCIFTIHPQEILKILPREHLTRAFVERVTEFESSVGIFSLYGVVERDDFWGGKEDDFAPSILSLFPTSDLDELIDPGHRGDQALVIMRSLEKANGKAYEVVNACEVSFVEHFRKWGDSRRGKRPAEYLEYKEQRTERIRERILGVYPEYRSSYKVMDSASPLTCRDYLNSPDGSAYGVKQKIGQFNLFGRLPLRNTYAAGQSALLPGLVGAMMSSFILGRKLLEKEDYGGFIRERLGS
jgi:phytoene dehydrogenase-like protein